MNMQNTIKSSKNPKKQEIWTSHGTNWKIPTIEGQGSTLGCPVTVRKPMGSWVHLAGSSSAIQDARMFSSCHGRTCFAPCSCAIDLLPIRQAIRICLEGCGGTPTNSKLEASDPITYAEPQFLNFKYGLNSSTLRAFAHASGSLTCELESTSQTFRSNTNSLATSGFKAKTTTEAFTRSDQQLEIKL